MKTDGDFPNIPGYLPIKEAAKRLGISRPRLYNYVKEKRIGAEKAGRTIMIPLEEIERFKLNPPGRARTTVPEWRVFNARSKLLGMVIQVQVYPGQQERLIEKLHAIQQGSRHVFPGTLARYVFNDNDAFTSVSIWLMWKDTEMPDASTRQQAYLTFQEELADVLDWGSASIQMKEGVIYT